MGSEGRSSLPSQFLLTLFFMTPLLFMLITNLAISKLAREQAAAAQQDPSRRRSGPYGPGAGPGPASVDEIFEAYARAAQQQQQQPREGAAGR